MSIDDLLNWLSTHHKAVAAPVLLLGALIAAAVKHKSALDFLAGVLRFAFGGKEEQERRRTRRLLARTLYAELQRIDRLNDWIESRFAQLEAEVEVETFRAWWWRVLRPLAPATTVRRAPSLSRALRTSRDQIIVLEGEPGAGKSVSMRRVAAEMLRRALLPLRLQPRLPVYLNLRDLVRAQGVDVNAQLIDSFVRRHLNRTANPTIEKYLGTWLSDEMANGRLLFLFDSFDEIPEVLASTAADEVVASYAQAIRDFAVTMSTCRAVIASREYRGPRSLPATRFRILRLLLDRQLLLVRRFGLGADGTHRLEAYLGDPAPEMRPLVENPMFLALTCKRLALDSALPDAPRDVFSSYVETRLKQFHGEIKALVGCHAVVLRAFAQAVAFEMGMKTSLGLSPSRANLLVALADQGHLADLKLTHEDGHRLLDALEIAKIGRPGDDPDERSFTFVHRRFQEFFAAERILADPTSVPPAELVADARWREAAVALMQTQNIATATRVLDAAHKLLKLEATSLRKSKKRRGGIRVPYQWQPTTLHVLGILEAAYAGRTSMLPKSLSDTIIYVLREVRERGTVLDLKWILEVGGVLPGERLAELFPRGDELNFDILRDTVLRSLAKLPTLGHDVRSWIHRTIVDLIVTGRMAQRKWTVRGQLERLKEPTPFFRAMRLASATRAIQAFIFGATTLIVIGVVTVHALQMDDKYAKMSDNAERDVSRCASCVGQCVPVPSPINDEWFSVPTISERNCLSALPCWRDIEWTFDSSLCNYYARNLGSARSSRRLSAITHGLVLCGVIVFGLVGLAMRGATADAARPMRAWRYRILVAVLIVGVALAIDGRYLRDSFIDSEDAAYLWFGVIVLALWSEGASLALLTESWLAPWLWPTYLFAWPLAPFGFALKQKTYGEDAASRNEPHLRERAVRVLGIWLAALALALVGTALAGFSVASAIVAVPFTITILAMSAWLGVHTLGYVVDLVTVSRALRRHGTLTMGVAQFWGYLFSIQGSAAAVAFIEAVERYELLARGDRSWRSLAALPGLILEDRERLARQFNTSASRGSRLRAMLRRVITVLVLDESFGVSARVTVRILETILLRVRPPAPWFVSSVKELPSGDDSIILLNTIRHSWQVAGLGRRVAVALVRLADQTR